MPAAFASDHNDVLILTDVQNDFCPGGALAVPDGDAVVGVINRLTQLFEHVIAIQNWHPVGHTSFASSHIGREPFDTIKLDYGEQVLWPDHCMQGIYGAAFHSDLNLTRAELVLRKGFRHAIDSYSAFFENDQVTPTGLAGYLRERSLQRIFLCGLATDFCVSYSAIDARHEGFEVVVIEDACRSIDLQGSLGTARASMAASRVVLATLNLLEGY